VNFAFDKVPLNVWLQQHESTRLSNAPDIRKDIDLFDYLISPDCPFGNSSSKIKANMECWRNDADGKTELKHKSCVRSIYKSRLYLTQNN
jgi:hypothetical protein